MTHRVWPEGNRLALVLLRAIIIAGIGLIVLDTFFDFRVDKKESRRQMLRLFEDLEPGQPIGMVEDVFREKNGDNDSLELYSGNPKTWFVQTPLEWGAENWLLWIEHDAGRIEALRIRISDSKSFKPRDAPPDKTFADKRGPPESQE